MKKTTFTILILLFATSTFCQNSTNVEFTGVWTVKNATISKGLDSEVHNMMQMMKEAFINSQFIFRKDGKFELKLKENAPEIIKELTFLNGQNWIYDPEKTKLEVGNNHLVMFVEKQNGKYYFAFSDTPIILEMEKS
ncbi:MAG TPA: hypothetical protein PKL31_10675 [Fulvivirga sp.]|nr:hypothetical protein [Fulvivirga sp.]